MLWHASLVRSDFRAAGAPYEIIGAGSGHGAKLVGSGMLDSPGLCTPQVHISRAPRLSCFTPSHGAPALEPC
jgi:hypothetical protein